MIISESFFARGLKKLRKVDERNLKTDFGLDSSGIPPCRMSVNEILKRIDELNR